MAKIKGEILIENKRKAAIVEQLIKMGFDPDPVKRWKEERRKRELMMLGEVEQDEDEEQQDENEEVCSVFEGILHFLIKVILSLLHCNVKYPLLFSIRFK